MTFSEDISAWIDEENLVGNQKNPPRHSSGNGILETAMTIAYEVELGENSQNTSLIQKLVSGISACKSSNGSFDKNLGRPDQITRDDLLAAASTQKIAGTSFADYLVGLGGKTGWDLKNTATSYPSGFAKPWDVAAYKLMSSTPDTITYFEILALVLSISWATLQCAFGKSDPSGDRLRWLMHLSICSINMLVDFAAILWSYAATARYGSVGGLQKIYYTETPDHPFITHGATLSF
jgi:hypothetical protein